MNEFFFLALIVAIIFAIKYYFFDLPLQDKKLFELYKIRDRLHLLEEQGKVDKSSGEYKALTNAVSNIRLSIEKGISFRIAHKVMFAALADKSDITQKLKQADSYAEIYKDLNVFLDKNIVPILRRKVLLLFYFYKLIFVSIDLLNHIFKNRITKQPDNIQTPDSEYYVQGFYSSETISTV